MRQAIHTRYLGPTNTRPSRIVAQADAGRLVIPWDHARNVADNHRAAALAFAARYGWGDRWQGGGLSDGTYAWVRLESEAARC